MRSAILTMTAEIRYNGCITVLKNIVKVSRSTTPDTIHSELEMSELDVRRCTHIAEQMFTFVNHLEPSTCNNMFSTVETHQQETTSPVTTEGSLETCKNHSPWNPLFWHSYLEYDPLDTRECETLQHFEGTLS